VSWLWRAAVILAVVAAVAVIMARKQGRDAATDSGNAPAVALAASHAAPGTPGIPRLVDVGADRCIPCKAMAPILADLRTEYAGRMQVDFIDVWKDPDAGEPYQVYSIPTQIFYGRDGRELERHQGFISKADILATWDRHGYNFSATDTPASQN
jgi:thioredoxin 1